MSEPTYPRREPCPICGEHEVEVVGPGDVWAICLRCHWALVREPERPTPAELLRDEEERMRTRRGGE